MTTTLSLRARLWAVLTGSMAILALVVASASGDAATITVNTFSQIAPGQCTIATAIASINAAADQVGCTHSGAYGTSDTISLAAGTYASTVIDNGANAYPIINVALIINGNGATLSRTVGGVAPFFRFFEIGGGGLTLNNATLTGGNTTGTGASGGAIFVDGGVVPLSVSGSTFSNNTAGGSGGAIFEDSDLGFTISNTTFTGNTAAGGSGGAIFDNTTDGMTLTNTTFTGNTAAAGSGGAIFDNSTTGVSIHTATFTGNSTTDGGGGAIFDNSSGGLVFSCGSVTNNSAGSAGNDGGGVFDNSTNGVQITQVAFSGNTATFRGGALFDNSTGGAGPVSNNSFVGNTAPNGGGIYRTSPTLNAINNWWGAPSGPSGAGPGTGDAVSTDVTFAPFLTSPPSACGAGPPPPPPSPSQPIPTLSDWTLWVVTFLLLGGGMWAIRRRVR
jgi:predicted outer membrane repeat protein